MTLIYHPWRGGNDESSFSGGGGFTRVMTPIHHLRMSHHSDAHKSCTMMLPVSKNDAHLSPMERCNDESSFSGGGGPAYDALSSSEDESSF